MRRVICIVFFAAQMAFVYFVARYSYKRRNESHGIVDVIRRISVPAISFVIIFRCVAFVAWNRVLFLDRELESIRIMLWIAFIIGCIEELWGKKKGIILLASFIAVCLAFTIWSGRTFKYEMFERIQTPGSSCFSEIGYDEQSGNILVTFRDSGATYIYDTDDELAWKHFREAPSLGQYYNEDIKGIYKSKRIN